MLTFYFIACTLQLLDIFIWFLGIWKNENETQNWLTTGILQRREELLIRGWDLGDLCVSSLLGRANEIVLFTLASL